VIDVPLFRHSRGKGYIPLKEIAALRERGLSDRDIIARLKEQGFSYDEIEKGILQSLKGAVGKSEEQPKSEKKEESMSIEDIYAGEEEESVTPPSVEEMTYLGEEVSPELTIEELVEGVVNEKWEVFEKELKSLRDEQTQILREIKNLQSNIANISGEGKSSELIVRMDDLETKVTNIESRVNALEKAFKQFLPSLIENVRTLTSLVKEMKKE
jgi:chaperonin cofactor prefoldin